MIDLFQTVTFCHFLLAFWWIFGLKLSLCRHFSPNHITTKGCSLVSKPSFPLRQTIRKVPSNPKSPKSDRKWQMKHLSITYKPNNINILRQKVTDDGLVYVWISKTHHQNGYTRADAITPTVKCYFLVKKSQIICIYKQKAL